ncbi:MAG: glycosyl hydrolase 115 family protein [Lachnospiraceae bacterium]|nr:glycosyl hydrolase 115 family protein [Lachnospiraceae bacterium]
MDFTIDKNTVLCLDENDWPGVIRVADKVRNDMEMVFGKSEDDNTASGRIYAGCIGRSAVINDLESKGIIDLSQVRGRREVYLFTTAEVDGNAALVIAGSDKRGTIYGLFHISELMNVSPWVWFADVTPEKKESVPVTDKDCMISKEPSVRFRGFFINDEWPSFGTWSRDNFGGFNARVYDHVFELLLRMHGNYLWPAMWSSCFSEDGPGIESAKLADEYGVVMGTSHHEPCMRHGEEFSHVKGLGSVYGNDWNFNRNREGLINFWRDGLKRNAPFENVVTVGMRGEADSEMLGRECTVLDNINYLKDVITTQEELIREVYGDRASEIDKVFAVYKEVESFYYGDEENEGLRSWEGLDGTIILLSDDNHGNMRLLPPKEDRDHKGGFGMYYHLDYHGGPISYEWVNSTYIPRIAEQMGQAWECGVRDLWIVNVGDIKPVEFPLNYFMDLAYDYDRYSDAYASYAEMWAKAQFGYESEDIASAAAGLLEDYTRINSIRRPETISPMTYSTTYFDEVRYMLLKAEKVIERADAAMDKLKGSPLHDAFFQLVYFPAKASMNVLEMNLYAGMNMLYAQRGCPSANCYAERIRKCTYLDERLCNEYNSLGNGKWSGMMLSEHIGFVNWNEEEHRLPVRAYVKPYDRARICVSVDTLPAYTMGGDWTRKELLMTDLLVPGKEGHIRIENCCSDPAEWKAEADSDWIVLSSCEGMIPGAVEESHPECMEPDFSVMTLTVRADRNLLHKACEEAGTRNVTGSVKIVSGPAKVWVKVCARDFSDEEINAAHYVPYIPEDVKLPRGGASLACAIEAAEYESIEAGKNCAFKVYDPYGKYHSAMRVVPADASGNPGEMPSASYRTYIPEEGEYEFTLCTAPGGPIFKGTSSALALKINDGPVIKISMVGDDYRAGENSCGEWCTVALVHEKKRSFTAHCTKGENVITVYGLDPGSVLMRMVIRNARGEMPESYLGPIPGYVCD